MDLPAAEPSGAGFPAGPRYAELLDSDPDIAWVRYKVWAADWYVARLGELGRTLGDYDRWVGVEMAIDGAVGSLSGAFDAAVATLIVAAENALDIPGATPPHRYSWGAFVSRVSGTAVESSPGMRDLIDDISSALDCERRPDPVGWLAILRRLRNRATHQTSLPRTWASDGDRVQSVTGVTQVPDLDPFEYLKDASNRISDLTESMLSAANAIGFIGATTRLRRERWPARQE